MFKRIRTGNKQAAKTLVLSFVAMGINYLIMLLLTPYITDSLGTEAYGFVSLAKTISNYGIVITSCLNAYSARFITIAYNQRDYNTANKYYSSVLVSNLILFVVVLLFDVVFVSYIEYFIKIPDYLIEDVKILFFIDIVNYMVLAIGNIFNVYVYICNTMEKIHLARIISYTLEAVILILLFFIFDAKVYFVGIALLVSSCALAFINYLFFQAANTKLKIRLTSFSLVAVKNLVLSGIWNSINNVGNLLNTGLDLWVSNLLLSPTAVGELSIVKTVSTIFTTIAQLISGPFHPQLLKAYSEGNKSEVTKIFNKQICLSGYVVCVVTAGFLTIGSSYFGLWTPNQNVNLLSGIAIVTVIGFVFECMATPLFYTYTLTLKNKVPCIVTIISGILNVLGMYVLVRNTSIGLYGVVGTTSALGFGTYFIFTPLYSAYCLGVKWNTYYPCIFRNLLSILIVCFITKLLPLNALSTSWLGFIVSGMIICIIALPIHILCSKTLKNGATLFGQSKNAVDSN